MVKFGYRASSLGNVAKIDVEFDLEPVLQVTATRMQSFWVKVGFKKYLEVKRLIKL